MVKGSLPFVYVGERGPVKLLNGEEEELGDLGIYMTWPNPPPQNSFSAPFDNAPGDLFTSSFHKKVYKRYCADVIKRHCLPKTLGEYIIASKDYL
ncbi:hypothetical protein NXH76_24010 [Blautia schinkii]|nr:hypothetical protein [Blautia schinkii]